MVSTGVEGCLWWLSWKYDEILLHNQIGGKDGKKEWWDGMKE